MRLPHKKKPGDPVLAADWNTLLEAIAARTPCSGHGLEFFASSGGFSYSLPPPKGQTATPPPPFSVIAIDKERRSIRLSPDHPRGMGDRAASCRLRGSGS